MQEEDIFEAAREITGNKADKAVSERYVPDEAIRGELISVISDLNRAVGGHEGRKEITFDTVPDQQDYLIDEYVGDDVHRIESIARSSAYIPDNFLAMNSVDPRNGLPMQGSASIPQGYQDSAMDAIVAAARSLRNDRFDWEVLHTDDGRVLRLYPCPVSQEKVSVRYVTSGHSIETLPEIAKPALIYAACVAIFNLMLNRINSQMLHSARQPVTSKTRMRVINKQRNHYQARYEQELLKLRGG